MTISSRQNPWFKRIREAIRDHAGEIVIEGPKAVADAIAAGWKPIKGIERDVDFSAAMHDAPASRWRSSRRAAGATVAAR